MIDQTDRPTDIEAFVARWAPVARWASISDPPIVMEFHDDLAAIIAAEVERAVAARAGPLVEACRELVRLKDIKDSDPEQHGRLKSGAWDQARAALAASEAGGERSDP